MQQRYYDPMAARLLSVDPVFTSTSNGSSFNRYIYANNNPYRYIDPDGRESASLQACLGFCLGGTVGYNRTSGEFAFTLDIGAGGLGGGLTVDPSASNGRMENLRPNSPQAVAGVTAAGYAKVSATIATPAGSLGAEAKAGGGKDLKTGAVVRAKELNFLLGEGAKGFKVGVFAGGGTEISGYVKPGAAIHAVGDAFSKSISDFGRKMQAGVEQLTKIRHDE